MVKNTTGGNKAKKLKRNYGRFDSVEKIDDGQGQMFGMILKNNGVSFDVLCTDGMKRKGRLCGEMKKGPRIREGSFVVITLRDYEQDKKNCDIVKHGNPSNDVIGILTKNDVKKKNTSDIEFVETNDEFKEFQDVKKKAVPIANVEEEELVWDDI